MQKWTVVLLGIFGSIFSLIMMAVPYICIHKEKFIGYISDPFAKACFSQDVSWMGIEYLFGLLFFIGVVVMIILISKKKIVEGVLTYGVITILVLTLYLKLVIHRIEQYSQGKIIEFYNSLEGQDVYLITISYKTYAHYFYFKQPPYINQPHGLDRRDWLTRGTIDKPVYIIVKNTEKYVKELPDVSFVTQAGGYMIYRRERNDGL
jgi:hypothetical protein